MGDADLKEECGYEMFRDGLGLVRAFHNQFPFAELGLILSGSTCPLSPYGRHPGQGYTRHVHSINLSLCTLPPHQAPDHFALLVLPENVADLLPAVRQTTRAVRPLAHCCLFGRHKDLDNLSNINPLVAKYVSRQLSCSMKLPESLASSAFCRWSVWLSPIFPVRCNDPSSVPPSQDVCATGSEVLKIKVYVADVSVKDDLKRLFGWLLYSVTYYSYTARQTCCSQEVSLGQSGPVMKQLYSSLN